MFFIHFLNTNFWSDHNGVFKKKKNQKKDQTVERTECLLKYYTDDLTNAGLDVSYLRGLRL